MASRLEVAAHPVAVGALVTLVVNDHVLKAWSGGVEGGLGVVARTITGKASDVAGVLLLALWLGALGGRRRPAVTAVGVSFAALKLSPLVAELAIPVLGGRTRTDPSDLLALVALLPAHRILRPLDDLPRRDLRPAWASLRSTLGLAIVVISVPAMTATSKCPEPSKVVTVGVVGDDLVAGIGDEIVDERYAARSGDEIGVGWYRSVDGRSWVATALPDATARSLLEDDTADEACTDDLCYRARRDRVDQRTEGGRWERSFSHRGRLPGRGPVAPTSCPDEDVITFGAIAAHDDVVVVANGTQGVVSRRGDGDWARVPVGTLRPDDLLPTPSWPNVGVGGTGLAALGVLLLLLTTTARPPRKAGRGAAVAWVGALLLLAGAVGGMRLLPLGFALQGIGPLVIAVLIGVAAWFAAGPRETPRQRAERRWPRTEPPARRPMDPASPWEDD